MILSLKALKPVHSVKLLPVAVGFLFLDFVFVADILAARKCVYRLSPRHNHGRVHFELIFSGGRFGNILKYYNWRRQFVFTVLILKLTIKIMITILFFVKKDFEKKEQFSKKFICPLHTTQKPTASEAEEITTTKY